MQNVVKTKTEQQKNVIIHETYLMLDSACKFLPNLKNNCISHALYLFFSGTYATWLLVNLILYKI